MAITRSVSTAIILETRFPLKDGSYPIKLRVTHNRKQKYYALGKSLSKVDYESMFSAKPTRELKKLREVFAAKEKEAIKVIEDLAEFDFKSFEQKILITKDDSKNVFTYYSNCIDQLNKEGRAGNSSSYVCSLNSIKSFVKKDVLPFSEITTQFLKDYELWMIKERNSIKGKVIKGKSLTTVGMYLRALRSLYNEAIRNGIAKQESYPFGRGKYQIPAGRNVKKALKISDIEKIFNYKSVPGSGEERARDLWLFSYLCNGANIKDIARLKYKNIDAERIIFTRAKTERTSRKNLKPIVAILTPEIGRILDKWQSPANSPNDYVFNILKAGDSPEKELAKTRQATKTINKYIKRIGKNCGIDKNITTYTARHSFSTVLKRSGAPIEFISESLGHSNLKTTESYLDSFEDSVKKQYATALTNFTKTTDGNSN